MLCYGFIPCPMDDAGENPCWWLSKCLLLDDSEAIQLRFHGQGHEAGGLDTCLRWGSHHMCTQFQEEWPTKFMIHFGTSWQAAKRNKLGYRTLVPNLLFAAYPHPGRKISEANAKKWFPCISKIGQDRRSTPVQSVDSKSRFYILLDEVIPCWCCSSPSCFGCSTSTWPLTAHVPLSRRVPWNCWTSEQGHSGVETQWFGPTWQP